MIFVRIILPQIRLIAFRKKLFDPCDSRKLHSEIIPRLGGVAFQPVVFFTLIFILGINLLSGNENIVRDFLHNLIRLSFGFCAALLLYLIGVADDLIRVRYRTKFLVQIAAGILLVCSGLWIKSLHGLFGIDALPPIAGYVLTVIVVVFILNAVNLIDGIDGLAAGLGGIALLYYGFIFVERGQHAYGVLAFSMLGAIVPFFYYNVFGDAKRGRKIFMGDTGSLSIGIMLGILSIAVCNGELVQGGNFNAFVLAFSPLIVPCFDVLRVFLHRLRNRQPPFSPDKNHIHHKLLAIGLSQRQTRITLLSVSVFLVAVNLLCSPYINVNLLMLLNILGWTGMNIRLSSLMKRRNINKEKQYPLCE